MSHFSLGRCWMGRLSFNKIFLEENEKKKSPKKGIEKNIGTENVSMLSIKIIINITYFSN